MASDHASTAQESTSPQRHRPAFTRVTLAGSLALPLIGVYALVASGLNYWPHANALTWYAVLICGLLELAIRRGRGRGGGDRPVNRHPGGLFLSLAALHLFLLTPEVYLRLAGFRYEPGIAYHDESYHGAGHPSRFVRLVEDEALFWTLPPGSPGVNPQGFKTRPLPRPAAPDLSRVVFLGDSLAYQGYPEIVETLLNTRPDDSRRYEVLNMSLAGYSSYQGRRVVEKYGDAMASEMAVIGYGWNDHWLARGVPDGDKVVRVATSPAGRLAVALYRRSRLTQAARYQIDAKAFDPRPAAGDGSGAELRVSPVRFRDNLVFLGEFWQARGGVPIFLTLPSSHDRLGVPDYLVEHGYARDKESVLELTRAYNQIIRGVAAEHGWPVLDLERQLAPLAPRDMAQIFISDGIHLTPAGLALFAQRTAALISDLSISDLTGERPTAHE